MSPHAEDSSLPAIADLSLSSLDANAKATVLPFSTPASEIQNIAYHAQPPTQPPSTRTVAPTSALKRSSPFQFGTRYLEASDDVFAWNAWDHVDPSADATFVAYAAQQLAFQRAHAASDYDRRRYHAQPEKLWDQFYKRNEANFFKDRKWLRQEFPVLAACTGASGAQAVEALNSGGPEPSARSNTVDDLRSEVEEEELGRSTAAEDDRAVFAAELDAYARTGPWNTLLEIGAGAGNSAFPLLAANANPKFLLHAVDFASSSVALLKSSPRFDPKHVNAVVWDMAAAQSLPPGVVPGSVDAVLLVFAFSALAPDQWSATVQNVWRALRPGGEVCFRDYGRGDLAQVRFKKGRWLGKNFYARGDGTRVYFFEEEELRRIWGGEVHAAALDAVQPSSTESSGAHTSQRAVETLAQGRSDSPQDDKGYEHVSPLSESYAFEVVRLGTDRRLLVNRKSQLKMYRCWMQGRFRKPLVGP